MVFNDSKKNHQTTHSIISAAQNKLIEKDKDVSRAADHQESWVDRVGGLLPLFDTRQLLLVLTQRTAFYLSPYQSLCFKNHNCSFIFAKHSKLAVHNRAC